MKNTGVCIYLFVKIIEKNFYSHEKSNILLRKALKFL